MPCSELGQPGMYPAPGVDDFTGLVELDDWRCGNAALRTLRLLYRSVFRSVKRTRALIHPNIVVLVGSRPTHLSHDPVVRQRLRPVRIDEVMQRAGVILTRAPLCHALSARLPIKQA